MRVISGSLLFLLGLGTEATTQAGEGGEGGVRRMVGSFLAAGPHGNSPGPGSLLASAPHVNSNNFKMRRWSTVTMTVGSFPRELQ